MQYGKGAMLGSKVLREYIEKFSYFRSISVKMNKPVGCLMSFEGWSLDASSGAVRGQGDSSGSNESIASALFISKFSSRASDS